MDKEITLKPEALRFFYYGLRDLERAKQNLDLAMGCFSNCAAESEDELVNSVFI